MLDNGTNFATWPQGQLISQKTCNVAYCMVGQLGRLTAWAKYFAKCFMILHTLMFVSNGAKLFVL